MALTGDSLWLEVAEGLVTDGSRLDEDKINFITVLYCIVLYTKEIHVLILA